MATEVPKVDRADLAWAAGFFDGEGSTIARAFGARRRYYQLNITVPQAGHHGIPPLFQRFQRVMLGLGQIAGPFSGDGYMLRFSAREEADLVLRLLSPHLGEVASGLRRRRKSRKPAPEVPTILDRSRTDLERAWSAEFLEVRAASD